MMEDKETIRLLCSWVSTVSTTLSDIVLRDMQRILAFVFFSSILHIVSLAFITYILWR